jgi:hypothetical protein
LVKCSVRCGQARRRPVNAGGDRRAELYEGGGLKERVVLVQRLIENKTRQDAPGGIGEGLADVQHPSRKNRFEKMRGFVFFG